MKNVFARTVLALVLIPSFWMTSVGTAAAERGWKDTPGVTVGKMADCVSRDLWPACSNPIRVSFTVVGFFQACMRAGQVGTGPDWTDTNYTKQTAYTRNGTSHDIHNDVMYMQFVPDYSATNTALSGLCYYYEPGNRSGKSGPHTWRWDYR